ncbi:MAG: helix-turn-helix domain-containing protein [Clostridia bacterium]|nr:helix-turn-helix domain-containing protein [Clostridia bacterium]
MKERMPAGAERFARVIREGRTSAGLNQQQLAEKLGVSRATVAGWETSHSRPDLDLLPKLCNALGVSVAAFFGVKEKISPEERNLLIILRNMEEEDRMAILWQAEALMEKRRSWRMQELRKKAVRLYRSDLSAAAGIGAMLDEARGEQVWLLSDDRTRRADEIITVNGCSMEPTFFDGDELLVEHTTELREGEIGIFLVDGAGYVKEYRRDGLHSYNPAYPTMRFSEDSDVRCVGRVLGKVDETQWPTKAQMELLEEMRI